MGKRSSNTLFRYIVKGNFKTNENIYFDNTINETIKSYTIETIQLLESINIRIYKNITFKHDKLRKPRLGIIFKEKEIYFITINSNIKQYKDYIVNNIIHEIVHVLTDLRGGHNGHGKEFNRYAKYIREYTKYNIQRYSFENTDIIEDNLFKGLNSFNQKKLLEEKINVNDNYLIVNFKDIYFSLENLELQKELALYYLENHIFK